MALIKCRECGQKISNEASSCPNCGAPKNKPTGCGTWILFFIVISVLGQCSLKEREYTAPKPRLAPIKQVTKPYAPFASFKGETSFVSSKIKCNYPYPKISSGSSTLGKLYSCISGKEDTVKFFINEDLNTQKVKNIKFLWNDWTRNMGNGTHTDKKIAKSMVSALAEMYAPDKKSTLIKTFFSKKDKIIKSRDFSFEYTYYVGPEIDERMIIVTKLKP